MPIQTPNPFEAFTPLQKAMLYRVLISYKNKTASTVFALSNSPNEIDDESLMLDVASFQLEQINELQLLLEQNISVDELAIMPYITQYIQKNISPKPSFS